MSLSAIQPNEAPASILVPIQKGFGLLSARASLDFADLPLTLAIYGQNLTDKKYKAAATTAGPPINRGIYFPGAPLTFGASATYRF
jgi:iron complex outermembrane receptor protein